MKKTFWEEGQHVQGHGGWRSTGACGETGRGEFGAHSEGSSSNEAPVGTRTDSEKELEFCLVPLVFPVIWSSWAA